MAGELFRTLETSRGRTMFLLLCCANNVRTCRDLHLLIGCGAVHWSSSSVHCLSLLKHKRIRLRAERTYSESVAGSIFVAHWSESIRCELQDLSWLRLEKRSRTRVLSDIPVSVSGEGVKVGGGVEQKEEKNLKHPEVTWCEDGMF